MLKDKAKNGSDDGSLNELAASIASKLARNAAPLADFAAQRATRRG